MRAGVAECRELVQGLPPLSPHPFHAGFSPLARRAVSNTVIPLRATGSPRQTTDFVPPVECRVLYGAKYPLMSRITCVGFVT